MPFFTHQHLDVHLELLHPLLVRRDLRASRRGGDAVKLGLHVEEVRLQQGG